MKELSVIVPVYNTEKYLDDCLNSLISQDIDNFEVIIVDDNSTDNSLDIIKKYCSLLPEVFSHIHLDNNNGVSIARNIGLKYAKGEYIGFVDSDDFIHRYMYSDMLYLAKSYRELKIVSTGLERVKEDSCSKDYIERKYDLTLPKIVNISNNPELLCYESPSCSNKIFRKDLFNDIAFLPFVKWEDIAFVYPILLRSSIMGVIPSKYYFYRNNNDGIMASSLEVSEDIFDIFQVCDYVALQTKKDSTYDNCKEEVQKLQVVSCLQRLKEINGWNVSNDKKVELLNDFNKLIICKYGMYDIDSMAENFDFIGSLDFSSCEINQDVVKRKILSNIRSLKS